MIIAAQPDRTTAHPNRTGCDMLTPLSAEGFMTHSRKSCANGRIRGREAGLPPRRRRALLLRPVALGVLRGAFAADEKVVGRFQAEHVGDFARALLEAHGLKLVAQERQVIGGDEDVVPGVALRPEEARELRVLPQSGL